MAAASRAGITGAAGLSNGFPSRSCDLTINASSLRYSQNPGKPQLLSSSPFNQGPQAPFPSSLRTLSSISKAVSLEGATPQATRELTEERPVVVIDNYDSFTYNLVQYLGSLGCALEVYRNDEITIEELNMKQPSGIVISPGPGTPQESGISLETVLKLGPHIPLFGVCMGLQCMGEAFGGRIIRSPFGVMHGKKSLVYYDEHGEDGLLAGLPNPFFAGRYHSLVIEKETFPNEELEVTAWTEDGLVMGVRHKRYRHVQGVQFHPESIITDNGMKIMENFLKILSQEGLGKRGNQTVERPTGRRAERSPSLTR